MVIPMSYTALYRKFRPNNFEEVKGQEHIVTTLTNQIITNRIGHAYLFCGTRGTGKTSIAKIFAKTVNCEQLQNGNPCGVCGSCQAIAANASIDVIEMDAASNNGVDNIRDIVEKVSYSPAQSKYKVYIIDEVHMLSIGAFNALLKTLEEPPSYAIFILATTEANKIPITILSRCQRYDFKRITNQVIGERLQELIHIEQLQVEEKAIHYLARMGDGSMRDALSLLEQCLAFHYDELLTYEHVLEVLGAVDTKVFDEFMTAIMGQQIIQTIEMIEDITMQGREYVQFISDFTWYLRNILLIKTSTQDQLEKLEDIVERSLEQIQAMYTLVEPLEIEELYRYIRIFSELSSQMKYATQKRILLETTVIKLCKPSMETTYDALVGRIKQLEERLEKGDFIVQSGIHTSSGTVESQGNLSAQETQKNTKEVTALLKALPAEIRQVASGWGNLVMKMPCPMKQYLSNANISVDDQNVLLIVIEDGISSDYFTNNRENVDRLQEFLSLEMQKEIPIEVRKRQGNRQFEQDYPDLEKLIHMEIEIIN